MNPDEIEVCATCGFDNDPTSRSYVSGDFFVIADTELGDREGAWDRHNASPYLCPCCYDEWIGDLYAGWAS